MKNCQNCKHKNICPQYIPWTNEYGMITKKELTLCSQYDKDMSMKYDLSELYQKIFEFNDVIKIIREEAEGFSQNLYETKLSIICKNDIEKDEYCKISDTIWFYKKENNLEISHIMLEESQFNPEDYESLNNIEFIEKEF